MAEGSWTLHCCTVATVDRLPAAADGYRSKSAQDKPRVLTSPLRMGLFSSSLKAGSIEPVSGSTTGKQAVAQGLIL